jgi:hypothetical protein
MPRSWCNFLAENNVYIQEYHVKMTHTTDFYNVESSQLRVPYSLTTVQSSVCHPNCSFTSPSSTNHIEMAESKLAQRTKHNSKAQMKPAKQASKVTAQGNVDTKDRHTPFHSPGFTN